MPNIKVEDRLETSINSAILYCCLVPLPHHVDSHTTSRALNVDNAHINRESPTVPNVNQKRHPFNGSVIFLLGMTNI